MRKKKSATVQGIGVINKIVYMAGFPEIKTTPRISIIWRVSAEMRMMQPFVARTRGGASK